MKYNFEQNLSDHAGVKVDKVTDTNGEWWVMKTYNIPPMPIHLSPERVLQKQFLKEVFFLKHLSGNPHIVQIHEVLIEKDKDKLTFITELLDTTLSYIISTKYYNTEFHIRHLMTQLLQGLNTIHSNGIYHRDIKPTNIGVNFSSDSGMVDDKWIDNNLTIKYIDFGTSVIVGYPYYNKNCDMMEATHHWMPPEYNVSRSIGKITISGDIYSLGIIFYYLIDPYKYETYSFTLLFDPSTIDWRLVRKIVGSNGANLLEKMLEIDPDKRITAIDALKHPFLTNKSKKMPTHVTKIHKQKGGMLYHEIPFLPTKTEFLSSQNEYKYLPLIIRQGDLLINKKYTQKELKVMRMVLNDLYMIFSENELSFEIVNYAIYLFQIFISQTNVSYKKWRIVSHACMFLSVKLLDYMFYPIRLEINKKTVEYEFKICESMEWKLPHPLFITKEPLLLDHYLRLIYTKKQTLSSFIKPHADKGGFGHFYEYYLINVLSSMLYMHPVLLGYSKQEQVLVILSFFFNDIEHDKNLRNLVIKLIKFDNKELYNANKDFALLF